MGNENENVTPTEPEATPVEPETTPVEPEAPTEPENGPVEPETTSVEPETPTNESEPAVEPTEPTEPEATPSASFVKEFELAHDDVRRALYELLAPYEKENEDSCWISKVYDTYFIYESCKDDALYKQGYSKTDDTVSFVGEREHINAEYVTDNELAILNEMRSNYAGLIEKLAQYEAEPDKVELLQSPDYVLIRDTAEFEKLTDRKSYFTLTIDELKAKCDNLLLEYVKKDGSKFAAKEQPKKAAYSTVAVMPHSSNHGVVGRYGTTFVK